MNQRGPLANLFDEPPPQPTTVDERQRSVGTAQLWVRSAPPQTRLNSDNTLGKTDGTDTVILLHPWTGSAHGWAYQEAALTHAGYRSIAYSRRGHRGSDCGAADDTTDAVADLAELIDTLDPERVHLVGSAAGAFTAAGFAIRHRGDTRLASLTLACSMLGIPLAAGDGLLSVTEFAEWKQLPHHVRELGPSYRAVNAAGTAAWCALHDQCRGDNPKDFHQRLGGPTHLDDLGQIDVPTLYVAGSADLYSPPPLIELFANRTPNAEMAVIDGVGHSAYWERPTAFNELVLDFIARH